MESRERERERERDEASKIERDRGAPIREGRGEGGIGRVPLGGLRLGYRGRERGRRGKMDPCWVIYSGPVGSKGAALSPCGGLLSRALKLYLP